MAFVAMQFHLLANQEKLGGNNTLTETRTCDPNLDE